MEDRELIRAAIDHSRLSASRFAREVLIRDPRTVRRWLAGEFPLPSEVRKHLEHLLRFITEAS